MKVSNPLTIIAIFAGVSEAMATVALTQLPEVSQEIFIYFVMFFPTLIVVLFFYVLLTKNTVLYAPSDFDDQSHYLEINKVGEAVFKEVDIVLSQSNKDEKSDSKIKSSTIKNAVMKALARETMSVESLEVLNYILVHEASVIEIATKLKMNIGSARKHIEHLEKSGLIKKVRNSSVNGTIWGACI